MTDTPPSDATAGEYAADPVEAIKADIAATRTELQETVDELSDRLNPKTQLHHATESLTETTKRAATEAGSAAKHGAAQARSIAHQQIGRAQHATPRRRLQAGLLVAALGVVGLVWWRKGRR